jgi:hypothetical protein
LPKWQQPRCAASRTVVTRFVFSTRGFHFGSSAAQARFSRSCTARSVEWRF